MTDVGETIRAFPMLGDGIGMASEVAHGSGTDLPLARKQFALPVR